jgi:hypothetical protein
MDCPHCRAEVEAKPHTFALGIDQDGTWQISNVRCPTCDRLIVSVCTKEGKSYPAWPPASDWARLSTDVPEELAGEYLTANQVLPYSEEASAAISRRLLHRVLASQADVGYGGLAVQIGRAIESPAMPEYLKEALETLVRIAGLEPDSVRSYRPDALTPPADGEAEWLLDVVRHLVDFYYVQPARLRRKLYAVEERLAMAAPTIQEEPDEDPGAGWVVVEEKAASEGETDGC